MTAMTTADTRRYPLHITIGTLFIVLILLLGLVLSWQNYRKTSAIILASADQVQEQITRELLLDFNATFQPVAHTLQLLALSPLSGAGAEESRLQSLASLSVALGNEPAVTAIQAGYGNGDFFIVRKLDSAYLRERFAAPDDAALVADHVTGRDQGSARLTRIYYDEQLRELARNPVQPTDYDPRSRPWYSQAGTQPSATAPYLFYFIGKAGATITVKTPVPGVVIAADVTLEQLSGTIGRHRISPGSEVVLFGADGSVLAYGEPGKLVQTSADGELRMATLSALDSPVLAFLARDLQPQERDLDFEFASRHWTGAVRKVAKTGDVDLYALMVSPVDELLADAVRIRWRSIVITGLIILLALPVVWILARRISGPLRQLAGEAGRISRFDFGSPVHARSFISEVDQLATAMGLMKTTINRFLNLINSLAGERDFDSLLQRITRETLSVSEADAVLTYLVNDRDNHLEPGTLDRRGEGSCAIGHLPRFAMQGSAELVTAAQGAGVTRLHLDRDSGSGLESLLPLLDARELALIALPLRNRQEEVIGVLCLLYATGSAGRTDPAGDGRIAFVRALSGFAAVSLESRHLLRMQEALLDAFIKLIAGAIDSKSPYTGGHCQRVPEITRLLARAACDSQEEAFRDFQLDEDAWEALDIASWLHDCGKVTTPEYVVDKSTKLETLYDRIHEIRMRFEVLKRDAEIRYWEQVAGGGDGAALRPGLEEELRQLDAEFAFVAECNLGGESMDPERIRRLESIGARSWTRTLDDRLGISWEEAARKGRAAPAALPVRERLLDDKPEHLIERRAAEQIPADNPWGFRLDVPQYKFNRGELYNLAIGRGTLTAEERYLINDHIVQTIIMLEKLPYPKHLRDVPLLAGCHHETLDGKGYPRRLRREEMPLVARMMAIADIFEALTASDRPYKKAKKLSEAIRIMGFMARDRHIDPDLFRLFLRSGVYLEYARRYLEPAQIDTVNPEDFPGIPV
jgi:HD-GYP domain-containing protein (c-di-GMP phosphodiesterase class II)